MYEERSVTTREEVRPCGRSSALSPSLLLPLLLLCSGCATEYFPISRLSSIGDKSDGTTGVDVTVGIQPFGDNNRYQSQAQEKKVTILKLTVRNATDKSIHADYKDIAVDGDGGFIAAMAPSDASDALRLEEYTYWLYSFLWVGYSSYDSRSGSSSLWLPVGLPIAVINFMKAKGSNDQMEDDLEKNAFPSGSIEPGKTASGMVYVHKYRAGESAVRFTYTIAGDTIKRQAVVAYKF